MFCWVYITCPQAIIIKDLQTVALPLLAHGHNTDNVIAGRLQDTNITEYANGLLTSGYIGVPCLLIIWEIFYPGSYLMWFINWIIKSMLIWMYSPGFIYGHVWPRIREWIFLRACQECSLGTEFGSDAHSVAMACEEKCFFLLFNQIHHVGY